MEKEKAVPFNQPQIPANLIQQGEAVARLAIDLAKYQDEDSWPKHIEGQLPKAWAILRKACLEVEATGRPKTQDDYLRFNLAIPKELIPTPPPPPPPPPPRIKFDRLFNKAGASIILDGMREDSLPESFAWQQLKPWDADEQYPSEEPKSQAYKIAWAVIDSRVRKRFDAIIRYNDLVEMLCRGIDSRTWDDIPVWMAKSLDAIDHTSGYFKAAVSNEEWGLLAKCADALARPHNRSVHMQYPKMSEEPFFQRSKRPGLNEDFDKGLPGPNPPEGATVESLYLQVKTWAEDVLEMWKKELVPMAFESFWTEGKTRGFLWEDVKEMAHHRKKNKKEVNRGS
jgi:hypothetical protein